ncbi:hypothetical protein DL93DRAFT_1211109 [Clavulina sp. PMI_390]|nr:hypothetical protein DL93DRAFT_1211109 [Clavulina sp. PMI_390]
MALNISTIERWGTSLPAFFATPNTASTALRAFLRLIVPLPQDKIPITWSAVPIIFSPLPLMAFTAYLSRRPGTWLWRLAIAPFASLLTLRAGFGYHFPNPPYHIYNFALGLMSVPIALKILEFAISPHGMLKMGEIEPGIVKKPAAELDRAMSGDLKSTPREHTSPRNPFVAGFVDAFEVCCSMRGIGWQFGTGTNVYLAPEWRDTTNKARFIRQTIALWLLNYTLFDVVTYGLRLVPGLGTPTGGSIFAFGGESMVKKYLISATLAFFTGTTFITGFEVVHQLLTLFAVGVLNQELSSCPHLFENPWMAVSLHDLWSRRWHQLVRQTFLFLGGYPLSYILSTFASLVSSVLRLPKSTSHRFVKSAKLLGFLVGTFIGSGLIHYWGTYAMGRGSDLHPLIFFSAQSIGIILERMWKQVTGRKVGGLFGRIWTIIWVVGGIQWCLNAWHERAFESEAFFPLYLSPAHHIIFPLLQLASDAMGLSITLVSPLTD